MSSGIYRVGQKVTPVDDDWFDAVNPDAPALPGLPNPEGEYTVSSISEHRGIEVITLREYPCDWAFEKSMFRPLVDESVRRSVSWTAPTPVTV